MLKRSTAMPSRLNTRQRPAYATASEFQCGSSTTALRPGVGNQRALARLFSGYGLATGEVKRRKSAYVPFTLAASFGSGVARVEKTCTSRVSRRKSVGAL